MPNEKTLRELGTLTGSEVRGPGAEAVVITGVGPLDQAGPGLLTFVADKKHRPQLSATQASAVIIPPDIDWDKPCLVNRNPYLAFAKVAELFAPPVPFPPAGVHPSAVVHPEAVVEPGAAVGPFCVVGARAVIGARTVLVAQVFIGDDTQVGGDCILYPQVVVRERIRIGQRVIIHPGAVLGADGFGFVPEGEHYRKLPQIGTIVIEDDVEIGAAVTIDRATLGETRLGQGCKIDNLVQIAHNVQIGPHTVVAAQTGFSGSTILGRHVMVGGQVGTAGHLTVGDNAVLAAQSGILRDVEPGGAVFGCPARPHREAMRLLAEYGKLTEMRRRIEQLEKRLKALEGK
ncbi:MAG: UDP-3-O-(3-hydroxymyristoyl)glucosamine N-acyltransferase [candidate division FCPU426 bacterium]